LTYFSFGVYGSIWDYGWTAFYDFFEKIKIIDDNNFKKWKEYLNTGIYDTIQFEDFCFVSKMPKKIYRDSNNELHNEKGVAVEWADGYKNFSIHGIMLSLETGEKFFSGKMTTKEILELENQEQKRVLLETIGWEKALTEIEAVSIEKTVEGELFSADLKDEINSEDKAHFLKVKDTSTERQYVIRVPPSIKTVSEARAWTFEEEKLNFTNLENKKGQRQRGKLK
jgi:hypothetical protein